MASLDFLTLNALKNVYIFDFLLKDEYNKACLSSKFIYFCE